MLIKIGYIALLFLVFSEAQAQKVMEKSWDASLFDRIEIISDEVYQVRIISEPTANISLRMSIEGEYNENVLLRVSEEHNTLSLTHGFTPYFEQENDKLAAHKVISMEIEIRVPERIKLKIKGEIVSVTTVGPLAGLTVILGDGNCVLKRFKGNADVRTINGSILVFGVDMAASAVKSKMGSVINELPTKGLDNIKAESVNGDITLLKSQE